MDGAQFDRFARVWAGASRRRVLAGGAAALLAALPAWTRAERKKRQDRKDRRRDRGPAPEARRSSKGVAQEGCRATGSACASDAGCCTSICERNGVCTRKKKKKGRKPKTILTGACRCVEPDCVPNNAAACAGKQCGPAVNDCGGAVSCGDCPSGSCLSGTCVNPPAKPTGLQASALDTGRIRLTWNDVAGESGYRLHNGDNQVDTVPANTTSYTVTGLAPNSYRCHFVRAFNDAGSSDWSDAACATTQTGCVPNSNACASKQCGSAVNTCGTTISCGSCNGSETCQDGTCREPCKQEGQSCHGHTDQADCCSGLICETGFNVHRCRNCRLSGQTCSAGDTCCYGGTCCNGTCVFSCCPRRHLPMTANCQCIDKGPVTLSVVPNSGSVARGSLVDVTVRLDMVEESHLLSFVSVGLAFNRAVLEAVSANLTSGTAHWSFVENSIQPGHVGVFISTGANVTGALRRSTNVLVVRFRALGNTGASTALSFIAEETKVGSLSECDQFAENILDASFGGTVTVQ